MVKRKLSDVQREEGSNKQGISSASLNQLNELLDSFSGSSDQEKFNNDLAHFVQKGYLIQVFEGFSSAAQKNSQRLIVTHADAISKLVKNTKSYYDITLPPFKSFLETQFPAIQKALLSRQSNVLTALLNLLDHIVNLDPKHKLLNIVYSSLDFTSLKNIYQALARPTKGKDGNAVRYASIRFFTSLFEFGSSAIRTELTSQKRLITPWFKYMTADPPELTIRALTVFQNCLVDDDSISRSTKSRFFNEWVLARIEALYLSPNTVLADAAHHFLIHIATTPGNGVCFKVDDFLARLEEPKVHNRALLGLLKEASNLCNKYEEDLTLAILKMCPELIYPWSVHLCEKSNGLAKLSGAKLNGTWITTVYFVCRFIRELPIPSLEQKESTKEGDTKLISNISSKPSSIEALLNFVLPLYVTGAELTSGILHKSILVKYFTLQIMYFAFSKYYILRDTINQRFGSQSEPLITAIESRLVICFPEMRHLFGVVNSVPESSLTRFLSLRVLANLIDCSPKEQRITHALSSAISQYTFDKVDVKGVDLVSILPILEIHKHTLAISKWYNKAGGRGKIPYSMFTALLRFAVSKDHGILTSKVVSHLTRMVAPTQLFFLKKEDATIMGLAPLISSLKAFVSHLDESQIETLWFLIDESVARSMRSPYDAFDKAGPSSTVPLKSADELAKISKISNAVHEGILSPKISESNNAFILSLQFGPSLTSDYHGIFYVTLCEQLKFRMKKYESDDSNTENLKPIKEWLTVAMALSNICGWDITWYDKMMFTFLSEGKDYDSVFLTAREDMHSWMIDSSKKVSKESLEAHKQSMTQFRRSLYSAPLFFMSPGSWTECQDLVPELLEQRIPIMTDSVEFLKLVLFSDLNSLLKVSHCRCQLPQSSVWGPIIFHAFIRRCVTLRNKVSPQTERWSVCAKITEMMKSFILDNVESMSLLINCDRPDLMWRMVFQPCFQSEVKLSEEICVEIYASFVDILSDFPSYELSASSYHLLIDNIPTITQSDHPDCLYDNFKDRIFSALGTLSYKYRIESSEDSSEYIKRLSSEPSFWLSALNSWTDHKVKVQPTQQQIVSFLPRATATMRKNDEIAIMKLFRNYCSWFYSQQSLDDGSGCSLLDNIGDINPPIFVCLDFSRAIGLIIQRDSESRRKLSSCLADKEFRSKISIRALIVLYSFLFSCSKDPGARISVLWVDWMRVLTSECTNILQTHGSIKDDDLIFDCIRFAQGAITKFSSDERIAIFRTVNADLYDPSKDGASLLLSLLCKIAEITPEIDQDLLTAFSKKVSSTVLRLTKAIAESPILSEHWLALASELALGIGISTSVSKSLGAASLNSLMEACILKVGYDAVQKLMLSSVACRAARKRSFQYTKLLMLLIDLTPSKNPLSYDFEMPEENLQEFPNKNSPHSQSLQLRRARLAAIVHSLFFRDPKSHSLPHVLETILLSYSGTVYSADRLLLKVIQTIESKLNISCLQQAGTLNIETGSERKLVTLSLFSRGMDRDSLQMTIRQSMMESTVRTVARPMGNIISLSDVKPESMDCLFYDRFIQSLPEETLRNAYDAHLILPVIALSLKSGSMESFSGPGYTEMLKAHFLGIPLAALSSFRGEIVEMALVILEYAFNSLEEWPIRDKSGLKIILSRAFSTIDQHKKEEITDDSGLVHIYPAVIGIFLGLSVRIAADPACFLYEKITRFLLNSPSINPNMIPLYDNIMLGDDSDHFKQVNWMVEMLASGLQSEHDMVLYDKVNVIDNCLSLETYCQYNTSSHVCQSIRRKVMRLIWQAQSISNGATGLLTRHAIITLPLIWSSRDCGAVMERRQGQNGNDHLQTNLNECTEQFGMYNRMAIRTYLGAESSKLKEWTLQKDDLETRVILPSQFIHHRSHIYT